MADTMKVFCPHCLNEFDVDVDAGEEVLNPTATITKHSSMRASWSDIAAEIRSGHGYRVLGQDDIVTGWAGAYNMFWWVKMGWYHQAVSLGNLV